MQHDLVAPENKIMTLDEAVAWRGKLRGEDQVLTLTNGCFDVMHRGHADYLNRARGLGDALLVALNGDASVRALKGPDRPIFSAADRAYMLASLATVDGVVIFDSPRCVELLSRLKPDVYVKGGDYTIDSLDSTERAVLQENQATIQFIPFVPGFSTTDLLAKIAKRA